MLRRNINIFILICIISYTLSGCKMPAATSNTVQEQTKFSDSVNSTLIALGTLIPPIGPPESAFTATSSLTPSPTLSLTPNVPMVSVSVDTNCRSGPGKIYDLQGALLVGETAEVVGRDPTGTYWYIRNPDKAGFCWLWGNYATISGNTASLPVYTPPPTPTAVPTVAISYKATVSCGGQFAPTFSINNTGAINLESVQITTTDTDTATVKTHTADAFEEYAGCPLMLSQLDLLPGEAGAVTAVSNPFGYNPVGHNMQATIKVCSENGLAGECITKSISFTP